MKLFTVLVLALPSLILAKGHNSTSTTSQCKEIARLTSLMDLASNATKLASATHDNSTKASAIQAKASAAATTLATLQTNTTLTALCDVVFASEATKASCQTMAKLEKEAAKAANATASDKVKTKAAAQANELAALQGNATLTTFCAGLKTQETCQEMSQLQKTIARAANGTASSKNSTKTQLKADKAQAKLAEMQANATLLAACSELGVEGKNCPSSPFSLCTTPC
ncbi:hypothetical protein CONLIGDRAFT_633564, partial [Coniochaeta ligniaria NRRL 30616]